MNSDFDNRQPDNRPEHNNQPAASSQPTKNEQDLTNKLNKERTKRRSRPLMVALITLLIAILGGVATLAVYKSYIEKPAVQPAVQQSTAKTEPTKITAANVVEDIKKSETGFEKADNVLFNYPIKLAGYNFYTVTEHATGVSKSVAYTDSSSVASSIGKLLQQKNFSEKVVQQPVDDTTPYIVHYASADVVCQVSVAKTFNNPKGNHSVDAACEDMSAYVSAAKAQKPFSTAFAEGKPDSVTNVVFSGMPAARQSKTAGYVLHEMSMVGYDEQTEMASVGGVLGLFYQTPEKTLHYFKSTQSDLPCSAYNTPDLKKAYAGEKCADSNGNVNATVKAD